MSQENENNINNITEKISSQFAAEKKKGIIAICLILVMVFMWIKMLGNKAPKSANAALAIQNLDEPERKSSIIYKTLPIVQGRNDVLARDFFSQDNLTGFAGDKQRTGSDKEITLTGESMSKGSMQRLAEKLKLEAIGLGEKPQAFINNKLLSIGDEITIKDGSDSYQCQVIEIEENSVIVKYKDSEIALKLAQTTATSVD